MTTGTTALNEVQKQAAQMASVDDQFEKGYAHLGWLILEVAEMHYWRVHHNSFRDYLKSISEISKKSVEQLQKYWLTVRDLSGTFSRDQLEEMGISKAIKLRSAKDYAIVLPSVIINAALDPKVTVAGLKKIINTTLKMPEDDGDWMDLDCGFYVNADERATIEAAVDVAMHTEPLTKAGVDKSVQMKDVMLKFAMEFLSVHSGDGQ